MNEQNLVPFNKMDPFRHREISRLGGIASGIKRKERRDKINKFYEYLEDCQLADEFLDDFKAFRRQRRARNRR